MKKIKMIKTILSFILLTTIHTVVMGQVSDSVDYISNHQDTCKLHKFNVKQLIAPTTLIGIGIIGLGSDWMEYQNSEIRDELQENIDSKLTIDDFSQYAPPQTRPSVRSSNRLLYRPRTRRTRMWGCTRPYR